METKYSLPIRIVHSLLAILVIAVLIVGFYMTNLPIGAPNKFALYPIHKAIGIVILVFSVVRVFLRIFTYAPPLPKNYSHFVRVLAIVVHYSLYVIMILMPLSGYVMSCASGRSISMLIFNFDVPLLLPENNILASYARDFHGILAYALVVLITLHILGSIKHLIDGQNVLKRII